MDSIKTYLIFLLIFTVSCSQTDNSSLIRNTNVDKFDFFINIENFGEIQDLIWDYSTLQSFDTAKVLIQNLENIFKEGEFKIELKDSLKFNFVLTFENGVKGFFKSRDSNMEIAFPEVFAYHIDTLFNFNFVPFTTKKTILYNDSLYTGSLIVWLDNYDHIKDREIFKVPDALRFFDAIIGNSDRKNNLLYNETKNRIAAIDNDRVLDFSNNGGLTKWKNELTEINNWEDISVFLNKYNSISKDSISEFYSEFELFLEYRNEINIYISEYLGLEI